MRWIMCSGLALLLACFALPARDAAACDCAPPPPPKEALEKAAAVFLAKVVKIEDDPKFAGLRRVHVTVERWWKGGVAAQLTVCTPKSGAACGFGFREGDRYLVYTYAEPGSKEMFVSLCSRTATIENAKMSGDFRELGESKAP